MLVCDLSEVAAMLDVSSLGTLVSFLDPIVVEVSRVLGYICRDLALVVGVGFVLREEGFLVRVWVKGFWLASCDSFSDVPFSFATTAFVAP